MAKILNLEEGVWFVCLLARGSYFCQRKLLGEGLESVFQGKPQGQRPKLRSLEIPEDIQE